MGLIAGQVAKGFPDEANEFTSDGNQDFVAMESPGGKFVEPAVEAVLGLPANFDHRGRLVFLPPREFFTDLRWRGVVLGAFNEQPTGVRVAAFGDGALTAFRAAGGLGGHQAQVAHELTGMIEAGQGSKLGHSDHGRHDLKAFKGHQGINSGLESPSGEEIGHGGFAAGNAIAGVAYGHEALLQNGLHGRMGKDEFTQVAHMGLSPVGFSLVVIAMLQEEGFEALTRPALVIDGIRACTAKVADRLIGGFRDVDGDKVPRPVRSGELFSVALIRLHAVTRLTSQFRGGDDNALVAELDKAADEDKAAGACLIAKVQTNIRAVLFAKAGDELLNCMEAVAHLTEVADFAAATGFGDSGGDGVFMDIEADVE